MRRILLSLPLLLLTLSPAVNAQTVSMPYEFTNASAADGHPPSLDSRRVPSLASTYVSKCLEWAFEIPIRSGKSS